MRWLLRTPVTSHNMPVNCCDAECILGKVFREYFNTALKTIGRQGVRVHDLRHFCGTQTARVGNLVETMDRLGHSTVQASMIYQGIVNGRSAAVADALSQLVTHPAKSM